MTRFDPRVHDDNPPMSAPFMEGMRRRAAPQHDWFLKEWLKTLGKKQADIVRDLDWNKAKISLMLRGEQPYTRDALNELADYLNLRPWELLMHPQDALAIRKMAEAAELFKAAAS